MDDLSNGATRASPLAPISSEVQSVRGRSLQSAPRSTSPLAPISSEVQSVRARSLQSAPRSNPRQRERRRSSGSKISTKARQKITVHFLLLLGVSGAGGSAPSSNPCEPARSTQLRGPIRGSGSGAGARGANFPPKRAKK